ncbi:MAG: carboxypeptidase-like regulatory domain-containing protein [Bacteroidales bacterium]|nr:carboxypeptidase-like regulatory domain-containing protein [Bacteroidales bacterium]
MKKFLLLAALLLPALLVSAQPDSLRLVHSVRGVVSDLQNGRRLESVHVSVPDRHYATVTNADGVFTIKSDRPIRELVFSYVGYKTVRQQASPGEMKVYLVPEVFALDPATVVSGDARQIVEAAIARIPENYSQQPELLECFYRETIRKRQRFTYISEAVSRIYKSSYGNGIARDRTALEKSRVLLSQKRTDTLSVKVMGGPTQAVTHDVVKNPEILFHPEELRHYHFEMDAPVSIDDRLQFVIRLSPGEECEYALYNGTLYIDRERLSFTRIELSLDMSDRGKATRVMLVRKPFSLRFTPRELSILVNYRYDGNVSRISYFRTTMRFACDWKRRLISTNYTAVNELVVTNLREPVEPIARSDMFRTSYILDNKAKEFLDPDFWKDYNIIEPSESLENAIGRLRKQR